MRVQTLTIENVLMRSFDVKDGVFYFMEDSERIVRLNLKTKQRTDFAVQNLPGCIAIDRLQIKTVNGEVYLVYCTHQSRTRNLCELEFNSRDKTVRIVNEVSIEGFQLRAKRPALRAFHDRSFQRCISIDSNSAFSKFFCWENKRIYSIAGLSQGTPIFTFDNSMYYATRWGSTFSLNSFPLNEENRKEKQEVTVLDDIDWLCSEHTVDSCVIDAVAYLVKTGASPKIARLDLRNKTLEDVTHAVDGFDQLSDIFQIRQDENVIHFAETDAATGLTNRYIVDVREQLPGFLEKTVALTSLTCSACQRTIQKEETLQCGQCRSDGNAEVLLCALCALVSHRSHDKLDRVIFASETEKNMTVEKFTSRSFEEAQTQLAKELARQSSLRQTSFEKTVKRFEEKAAEIRSNQFLTSSNLKLEKIELDRMVKELKTEMNEHESWKTRVLAVLRQ